MSIEEPTDFVRRFLLEDLDVRGAFVRLSDSWRQMQARRNYPDPIVHLLGQMSAVTVLIGSNLKQPGRLTFQVQGHGPVSLMVIDCSEKLAIRGMAMYRADVRDGAVPDLLGDGRLVLTLQSENAREPYQSLVPLDGAGIPQIFEHYLAQSEQQPARLWLAADRDSASGLFLQPLPGAAGKDTDGWQRVEHLASTVTPDELQQLGAVKLLTRLFAEETVRVFKPRPVIYECPEDWDKVRNMLRSLGREEVEAILQEHGEIVVRDDICNHEYRFGHAALDELFPKGSGETPTLH